MIDMYVVSNFSAVGEIITGNQFLITRALHFAQHSRPTYTLETFKLYSATQCDSDSCLIIRLAWLCKMESPSNQKLVATYNLAAPCDWNAVSRVIHPRALIPLGIHPIGHWSVGALIHRVFILGWLITGGGFIPGAFISRVFMPGALLPMGFHLRAIHQTGVSSQGAPWDQCLRNQCSCEQCTVGSTLHGINSPRLNI